MNSMGKIEIVSICQTIKMSVDSLYGHIKCNPELASIQNILDLAEGLNTAANKAALVAYSLEEKDLYHSMMQSSTKLTTLIEGVE